MLLSILMLILMVIRLEIRARFFHNILAFRSPLIVVLLFSYSNLSSLRVHGYEMIIIINNVSLWVKQKLTIP